MRSNRIRERLADGQTAIGASLNINSPHLVEFAGSLGFDWVFIDCEHGAMSESDAEHMIRSAEIYGMAPVVLVPANEAHLILRFLDMGAMGIVVPHVDTVDDARKAAGSAKYPPLGERGSNYGTGRNNEYGTGTKDAIEYYRRSNEETILFALIESESGVDHIDEIVAVDGIDATWLGPSDMALSMGLPDQAVVDQALDRVVKTTVASGKIAAVTHPAPSGIQQLSHFQSLGANVLAVNMLALLKDSATEWLNKARQIG